MKTMSQRLDEILIEVEQNFRMCGLSDGLYADYAKTVAKRYLKYYKKTKKGKA